MPNIVEIGQYMYYVDSTVKWTGVRVFWLTLYITGDGPPLWRDRGFPILPVIYSYDIECTRCQYYPWLTMAIHSHRPKAIHRHRHHHHHHREISTAPIRPTI